MPLMPDGVPEWLNRSEAKLAEKALEKVPVALADLATTQVALGAVDRLVRRGLLIFACFTPTDASHVLSRFTEFDGEAAHLGAQLLARQKTASGDKIAETVADIAQMSLDTLSLQSAISLLDAAFAEQGEDENIVSSSAFLTSSLKQRQQGDAHSNAAARTSLTLELPLIALGASALQMPLAL